MQASTSIEAALHLAVLLALLPSDRALTAARLAEFHALSPTSIAKLLQQLAKAGLIAGSEGRAGGYRLSRQPTAITALDIIEATDASTPAFRCREIRKQGVCAAPSDDYSLRCSIALMMDGATAAWRATLANVTLADLVARIGGDTSAKMSKTARTWLEATAR